MLGTPLPLRNRINMQRYERWLEGEEKRHREKGEGEEKGGVKQRRRVRRRRGRRRGEGEQEGGEKKRRREGRRRERGKGRGSRLFTYLDRQGRIIYNNIKMICAHKFLQG